MAVLIDRIVGRVLFPTSVGFCFGDCRNCGTYQYGILLGILFPVVDCILIDTGNIKNVRTDKISCTENSIIRKGRKR